VQIYVTVKHPFMVCAEVSVHFVLFCALRDRTTQVWNLRHLAQAGPAPFNVTWQQRLA
jgi:hypothetical protein